MADDTLRDRIAETHEHERSWQQVGTVAPGGDIVHDAIALGEATRRATQALASLTPVIVRSWRTISDGLMANHPAFMAFVYGERYPSHRRRCPVCNPTGFPRALRVDGNEHRRRTKRRNRR